MREEKKNQLISHIPIFLLLPIVIVIIVLPDQLRVYGLIVSVIDIIAQGIVYFFRKKVYFRFGYIGRKIKIFCGVAYIVVGLYWLFIIINSMNY